jgi:AcrR family transcriptional regulator
MTDMKTRTYRLGRRSEGVAATRARILGAVITLGYERMDLDPTLDRVAAAAGVSVQTVLRHFGSRSELLAAAVESAQAEVAAERVPTTGGVEAALSALVAHYERRGDFALTLLARERSDPRAADITRAGKRLHREWVEKVFADRLPSPSSSARDELVDLLVVATDVYAWKLLARDRGLDTETVERRMRRMTDALLIERGTT